MYQPRTIIHQRYEITQLIGSGGFGDVYKAHDQSLNATVALKHLTLKDMVAITAFKNEAVLLSNLEHSSLPSMIDRFDDGQNYFLVMKYIDGEDLYEQLRQQQRAFKVTEVIGWADQILDVLTYIHTLSPPVIHRDIKPSNIKITKRGQVKLLDFGIAKGSVVTQSNPQIKSVVAFSAPYAPPEQIKGTGTDARSDIYALGATLYQLLTNELPLDARSRDALMQAGYPDSLRSPKSLNASVPVYVSDAIMQALALNASQRPMNAEAFRELLHRKGRPIPILAVLLFVLLSMSAVTAYTNLRASFGSKSETTSTPIATTVAQNNTSTPSTPTDVVAQAPTTTLASIAQPSTTPLRDQPQLTNTLAPNNSPVPIATSQPESDAVVAIAQLNIRSGPGTAYSIRGTYPQGTPLRILGKNSDASWVNISVPDGITGWMFASNLDIAIVLGDVAIIASPPLPATNTPLAVAIVPPTKPASTNVPQPTSPPAPNFDGTWVGSTSQGGSMDFTVSGGRVTNIHFAHPLGVGPQLIGDCTGAGGWEGYESWLSQLRIGINTSGGFSSQNIQIRGIDRLLVEFSGSVGTNGFASGRLQEDTPDPNIAACTHRSIFDWSAQRQ